MKKLHWDSKWSPASPSHVRAHIASDSLASSRKQVSAQQIQVARARPSRHSSLPQRSQVCKQPPASAHLDEHTVRETKLKPSEAGLILLTKRQGNAHDISVLLLEYKDRARLAIIFSEAWSALNILSNINNNMKTLFPQDLFFNDHM